MSKELYSKLWDKGTVNIPPLSQHSTCCGVAVLGKFAASDGHFLAKVKGKHATQEEMDEYWEFVAKLVMGTGYRMVNFTDRTGDRAHNDVCGYNFYKFLSTRTRRLGKVIASPVRQAMGKPNSVQLYIWLPKMDVKSWCQATTEYQASYYAPVTRVLAGAGSAEEHVCTNEYGTVRRMFDVYPRSKDFKIYLGDKPTEGVYFGVSLYNY